MEKDAFSHREKYVMNSEVKYQRVRDQYKKDPETKRQRRLVHNRSWNEMSENAWCLQKRFRK